MLKFYKFHISKKKTFTDRVSCGILRLRKSFKANQIFFKPFQVSLTTLVIVERVETLKQFSLSKNLGKFENFLKGSRLSRPITKNHFYVSLRHWNNDFFNNIYML